MSIAACSGGGSSTPPPTNQTYTLTVNSTTPATGVAIAVSPADNSGAGNGTTNFTRSYNSGISVTLTAPVTAGGNSFSSWSGCGTGATAVCTVTMSANATVTANYTAPVIKAPTVTVTPASISITTGQSLVVTVAVSGSASAPTPTGTVTLTSGSYTSAGATLSGGNTSITVPAGSLVPGADTLTVTYTPDTASSSTYSTATGAANITVTALTTPIVTVTPSPASITTAQTVQVTIAVTGAAGGLTPTGTVTLTSGSYTSAVTALSGGAATVSVGAGVLPAGTDTLKAAYTPDAASAEVYSSTSGTGTVTVTSVVAITPNPATVTIGATQQFNATVTGASGVNTVTWSVAAQGSTLSPGTITAAGLFTTPYPAPATVIVTATSTVDTTKSGSVIVTLSSPAKSAGPALSVDAGRQTHAISPDIYGVNAYNLDNASALSANVALTRWGGNNTSRYNYQLNASNAGADYYFENGVGSGGVWPTGKFDDLVATAAPLGIKVVGTANVLGWVAKDTTSCSFPKSTYADQFAFDPYSGTCGDGEYANQTYITGNIPTAANRVVDPTAWNSAWATHVTGTYGTAASNKGVAVWDLDNEPSWWDTNHRDVHPLPSTYDEVTNNGIAAAKAIKTADATAEVSGPVIDYWWNYFYSKKDIELGWSSGPCNQPWDNPVDRKAHGGVPLIEYYLQQFKTSETTYGKRLLDYVDIHSYFAATYNGASVGLTTAGDTGAQQARMNSTRALWDPTYTDPNFPQPNYTTDAKYTSSCAVPAQAPQLIPMLKTWVANDYPGTKIAIDEYNFGGLESINGAVTQADILGIFGREGLDLGALWPTAAYSQEGPGNMAFAVYRNYDGKKSGFGDTALWSSSADQGKLSVYGAVRASDNAVTIVIINKTYGDLTSSLALNNIATTTTSAQAYLYSNANLTSIVAQPAVKVTPPTGSGTTSTMTTTFPAQSITLLVVPN
ncbi:MAG TPA: glycoside hydrolase family 44 protein [Terracidiphilus sp.]